MTASAAGLPAFATYLLILGEAKGLSYVLTEQAMAFTTRIPRGGTARTGDRLFLYVTQSALKRDGGRIIGSASVTSGVSVLDRPFALSGRRFLSTQTLRLDGVAEFGEGIQLAPLVQELEAFPDPKTWSSRLRRPMLLLSPADAALVDGRLAPRLRPAASASAAYLERADEIVRRSR